MHRWARVLVFLNSCCPLCAFLLIIIVSGTLVVPSWVCAMQIFSN